MKILAVDVSGVCRTFWEMYQSGRLSDGEAFNASIDRVRRAADGFDRVVLALDVGPSFRKLHCPEYKAKRHDPGEAYRKLVRDVVERLTKDGATMFPNKGEMAKIVVKSPHPNGDSDFEFLSYPEADDVIASLAAWYRSPVPAFVNDCHLRILSGDTDLWALVNDEAHIDVEQINGDRKVITEKDVAERFGGVGSWVTEVKALAGDDGDGYKPFPHYDPTKKGGIAEGKASRLLETYGMTDSGSEAAVVLHWALASDDDPHVMPDCHERKCLRAGGTLALQMGYACARMLTDLPLDFSRILAEPKVEAVASLKPSSAPRSDPPPAKQERALARIEPSSRTDLLDPNALQPQSLAELYEVGNMVVNSRIYPKIDSPEKAMMVIAEARERRIPYATALRSAYFVKGNLAWSASFIVGLVQRSAVCEVFEISETTPTYAVVDYKRKGRPLRQFKFELQEAINAGWTRQSQDAKGPPKWVTNPRVMLRWAAYREAARFAFPDVVSGMYTPDELRDGHVLDAEFEQTESDFEGSS